MEGEIEIARFHHPDPLALTQEVLKEAGVPFRTSNDALTQDASALGQSTLASSILLVPTAHLVAARTALLDEARKEVAESPDETHPLASAADDELKEVIAQPQHSSEYDLALAEYFLRNRGIEPPPVVFALRPLPVSGTGAGLSDAEPAEGVNEVKPVVLLAGFLFGSMGGVGHILSLGGVGGFIIALSLVLSTELGPDGRKRYFYSPRTRRFGLILFLYSLAAYLIRFSITWYAWRR